MANRATSRNTPPVSLIVTPCDQRGLFLRSLRSATAQDYSNLQVIVANDGGQDLPGLVASLGDPRIVLSPASASRQVGAMVSATLGLAGGQYVAHLLGGDVHYSRHVSSLVAALEDSPDCSVAYGDLYKTYFKPSGNTPVVLGKALAGGDDFDRLLLCRQDCIRLSAVMHRRSLLEQAGGFDEELPALAEWDFLRRLAFFGDFVHMPEVTGECFQPIVGEGGPPPEDPDPKFLERCALAVRAKRPPKPWPKMPDLSIILVPPNRADATRAALEQIRRETFTPHQVYLPLARGELALLEGDMTNVVPVPVEPDSPADARVDKAVGRCQGDHVAVVFGEVSAKPAWVEFPLHALTQGSSDWAFLVPGQPDGTWAAVFRKDELMRVRRSAPAISVRRSLQAAGVALREPPAASHPFRRGRILAEARKLQRDGCWQQAAEAVSRLGESWKTTPAVGRQALLALYHAGREDEALDLSRRLNQRHPTVNTLLLEGKLLRRAGKVHEAVAALREAHAALTRG